MPLRPIPILVAALTLGQAVAAPAAQAGDGFLDTLFGSGTAPPNPFASNYASGPPSPEVRQRRERRPAGAARPGREPVPPAAIPE